MIKSLLQRVSRSIIYFSTILLITTFLFTRLYHLDQTIHVFGDTARDLLELEEWAKTLKPPLLGPHTSALSFNQSAWYFWLLMPFYLISLKSIYTASLAVIAWYIGWFLIGFQYLRQKRLLFLATLICIHPQLLLQTRDVWNPSFILPLTLASIFIQLSWLKKIPTNKSTFFWSLFNLLALGLSYSLLPTLAVFYLFAIVSIWIKHRSLFLPTLLKMATFSAASAILVNIGTILFEIKYNLRLTSNLGNQQILQLSNDYLSKLTQIETYLLSGSRVFSLLLIIILAFAIGSIFQKRKISALWKYPLIYVSAMFLLTVVLTIFSPFDIYNHYIFGLISLFFATLYFLPKKLFLLVGLILIATWTLRSLNSDIFAPQSPTWQEKQSCLLKVCAQYPGKIYLVGNTGSHDHQALGYEYLGLKNNCDVVSVLRSDHQSANYMAVMSENTFFDLEKTDFYELNQFLPRQPDKTVSCLPNLEATVFVRPNSDL